MPDSTVKQSDTSIVDRYVTLTLLILLLGAALSALRIGGPIPTVPGLPLPDWRFGVLAGFVFIYGLVKQQRSK